MTLWPNYCSISDARPALAATITACMIKTVRSHGCKRINTSTRVVVIKISVISAHKNPRARLLTNVTCSIRIDIIQLIKSCNNENVISILSFLGNYLNSYECTRRAILKNLRAILIIKCISGSRCVDLKVNSNDLRVRKCVVELPTVTFQ